VLCSPLTPGDYVGQPDRIPGYKIVLDAGKGHSIRREIPMQHDKFFRYFHIRHVVHLGLTGVFSGLIKEENTEIVVQTAVFARIPATINALTVMKKAFETWDRVVGKGEEQ
jgi:hypothetical protein